ncbi:MAG: NAD(+) synthase [Candidatus Latescibacterota bacterium]
MTRNRIDFSLDLSMVETNLEDFLHNEVLDRMHRRGAVVGVSGGIDSAVVLALCARAIGGNHVLGLRLPERESHPSSLELAERLCRRFDVPMETIDITPVLDSFGVYEKREAIVHRLFPGFGEGWSYRLRLPDNLLEEDRLGLYRLEVRSPEGRVEGKRLSYTDFLTLTAATNIKQRVRMIHLYHAAESRRYAVIGTTNLTEAVEGFYVKYGDGGVDVEPIAHLYKTQVFMLAERLGIPEEICARTPSPDTYSFPVSDKEFYFAASYPTVDKIILGLSAGLDDAALAAETGLSEQQLRRLKEELKNRATATAHLREPPPSCPPLWIDIPASTSSYIS